MLESMINPQRLEKGEWKMLFIGILYASLSLLLVKWFFAKDVVLSEYSGILVVLFCVMFSLPFMYFIIKQEEAEDEGAFGFIRVWSVHKDAITAFMWLFLGFIIAFSFWYILLQDPVLFNAQVETYCRINAPGSMENCIQNSVFSPSDGQGTGASISATGASLKTLRFLSIVENNIYVMIFTLILSLIFGAGAIFVLAWNASVISAAIGIFTDHQISEIPQGIFRYMIHGFPEIAAYFITALAGGIFGVGFIRNGWRSKKFLHVVENVALLLFIAIIIIVAAALIEVYLTPLIF